MSKKMSAIKNARQENFKQVKPKTESKSANKKSGLIEKYNLPPNVYDGSCIPPLEGQPNYYKLAEDSEGKNITQLNNQSLATAAGVDMQQLASSYWKLLLGPTQFIYWDPSARNINNPKCPSGAIGKWIFISTARDILEGESPTTQCNNVIGGNEYLSGDEYKAWYNSIFNSKPINYANLYNHFAPSDQGFVEFRKKCCWICGFPLYPGKIKVGTSTSSNPPCEHILPVVIGISNLKLYQREDNSFTRTHTSLIDKFPQHDPLTAFTEDEILGMRPTEEYFPRRSQTDQTNPEYKRKNYIDHIPQLNQLLKEYAWSHTCCNSIKSDDNLITTNFHNNIYTLIPNEAKITSLLKEIWGGCFTENITFLNTVYASTSLKITIPKNNKDWIDARVENMYSQFLKPICDYANQIYSPTPLLYNLASIASIVHTVPKELRNLLLFSTISEDKINTPNVITYISLSDSISNIDTKGFKPNYQENANIVYSVANKIATVIQNSADTTAISGRVSRTGSRPVATASEYIALLNNLFEVTTPPPMSSMFTGVLINDNVPSQQKTNIPKYNLIISESIYTKFITPNIYNFYKLLFIYLAYSGFLIEDCIILSSMSYYVLLYRIILNKIKPYLDQATSSGGTSNLLTKLNSICFEFYKKEIENITKFLKNKFLEDQYKFKYYFNELWPIEPLDATNNLSIPPPPSPSVSVIKIDEISKPKALNKVDSMPEPAESNKINPAAAAAGLAKTFSNQGKAAKEDQGNGAMDAITYAQGASAGEYNGQGAIDGVSSDQDNSSFEQQVLSAKTEPEKVDLSIDHETKTFQSSLDMLVNELEKYNEIPLRPVRRIEGNIPARRTERIIRANNPYYGGGGRSTRKKGKKIKNKKRNTLKNKKRNTLKIKKETL